MPFMYSLPAIVTHFGCIYFVQCTISLTQFFKSTNNKRKLQGPDGDHETIVSRVNTEVFFQARAST